MIDTPFSVPGSIPEDLPLVRQETTNPPVLYGRASLGRPPTPVRTSRVEEPPKNVYKCFRNPHNGRLVRVLDIEGYTRAFITAKWEVLCQ